MANTIIALIAILLFIGGIVWLQVFLSKKNNKWLGLILPIISIVFSIFMVFILIQIPVKSSVTQSVNGVVISEEGNQVESETPSFLAILGTILLVFLLSNIPTLILIGIYFASRKKLNIKYQLDKMSIQDLE